MAANSWEFDAFRLDEATNGHALSTLGYYLMSRFGLIKHFKLPEKALAQ